MRQRITRREWLRWSAISAGAAVLAACAPKVVKETVIVEGTPKVVEKEVTKVVKETVVVEATAKAAPKEPVEVQVWVQVAFGEEVWAEIDEAFHAAQDEVRVLRTIYPFGDMEAKVLTALAADEPLDVMYVDPLRNNTYAVKGAIVPLDDYLPDLGIADDDWYPTISYVQWRGHTWGLPYQDNPTCLGYNPKLIEEAGLTPPRELWKKAEWTKEVYDEYVAKLTKGEGANKQFGTGVTGRGSVRSWQCMWLWGYGGRVFSEDETHTMIAEPEAIEAWNDLAKYHWNEWGPAPGDLEGVSAAARWEKIAMDTTTRWSLQNWVRTDTWPDMHMVPVFTYPGSGKAEVRNFCNATGIFSRSKNKDACWTYIKWMTNDGHIMLVNMGICTPLRKSLMDDKSWEKSLHLPVEDAEVYEAAADNVRFMSHVVRCSEIDKMIQAAFDGILLKEKTAEEAMSEIVPDIDEILAEAAEMPLPKLG